MEKDKPIPYWFRFYDIQTDSFSYMYFSSQQEMEEFRRYRSRSFQWSDDKDKEETRS